jgi:hypothetical protein
LNILPPPHPQDHEYFVPTLNVKACCFETSRCYALNEKEIPLTPNYVHSPHTKNVHGKIYSFKLAAIVSSTFAEIILVNSDCYIVRDPMYLL